MRGRDNLFIIPLLGDQQVRTIEIGRVGCTLFVSHLLGAYIVMERLDCTNTLLIVCYALRRQTGFEFFWLMLYLCRI